LKHKKQSGRLQTVHVASLFLLQCEGDARNYSGAARTDEIVCFCCFSFQLQYTGSLDPNRYSTKKI